MLTVEFYAEIIAFDGLKNSINMQLFEHKYHFTTGGDLIPIFCYIEPRTNDYEK